MQPYPLVLTVLRPLHPPTPPPPQVRERTASGTADVDYEVLNILEFNSTRKRMSVVVKDSHGRLLIFCKVCAGGRGRGGSAHLCLEGEGRPLQFAVNSTLLTFPPTQSHIRYTHPAGCRHRHL